MHKEPARKGTLVALTDGTLTEAQARQMLEGIRWPNGLACIFPDCGGADVYRLEIEGKTYEATATRKARTVGPRSLYKCKACRRQFSVTKGTIFEDSKIPLRTWITVMYRMCSSKKGVSALQIQREFGLSYESAWFMCHRIRYAMQDKHPAILTGTVEADETFIGGKAKNMHAAKRKVVIQGRGAVNKTVLAGVVERGGNVRTQVVPDTSRKSLERFLLSSIDTKQSRLMTDEHGGYEYIGQHLPHAVIRHSSKYVRGEVYTNTIESYWAILKRGLIGTFHQVDAGYLPMYASEFEFRYNRRKVKDAERFASLLGQVDGRLDWYLGKNAASSEPEA